MSNHSHKRMKFAVKRSVHFILTDKFADAVRNSSGNGIGSTFTREFWKFLDSSSQNNKTRKSLRQNLWSVWLDSGENTLSSPFTESTELIVSKTGKEYTLKIKETAGELTTLNTVSSEGPLGEDVNSPESIKIFESLWSSFMKHNGNYPSKYRPLTAPVSQIIATKTSAPMPIVSASILKQYPPSELSNGFIEVSKHSMKDEVFDETLVQKAINNGIAERVGPPQNFTFKIKKGKYQEWQASIASLDFQKSTEEEVLPED